MIYQWYDNDVRFDLMTRYLRPTDGEKIFEAIDGVEDTKGNNGEPGRLIITNLRLIWQSRKYPKINLSIGYNPITTINTKSATSVRNASTLRSPVFFEFVKAMVDFDITQKLRGTAESLHILAKTRNSRYEFIFTSLLSEQSRLFNVVLAVYKSYTGSRLYREIRMRSGLVLSNKRLNVLPQEEIVEELGGIWNLSSDQGNLGSFFITNVRVVWYAASNELFNASIPFLQVSHIKVRDSKFGRALVIETTEASGGYVLGFRIDPKDRLYSTYKTLRSIQGAFLQQPLYGVQFNLDSLDLSSGWTNGPKHATIIEDEETTETPELASDAFAAYFANDENMGDAEPIDIGYSAELGLAIQKPKHGFTMESLWEVIPASTFPSSSSNKS